MATFKLNEMPEVFRSTNEISVAVSRAAAAGELRKLGTKLYTTNLVDPLEQVVKRNCWHIAGLAFPGTVIVDRTAIESTPAIDGSIFLSSSSQRNLELPGITIRSRKGKGPLEDDRPFIGGLFISSPARAYLENMPPSRAGKGVSRRLSRHELEQRLDTDIRTKGENYINSLRDDARRIAPFLNLQSEQSELDEIIGTLLGTHEAEIQSSIGSARASGSPIDPNRIDLFNTLHEELMRTGASIHPNHHTPAETINLAFFEAYFSNFIEGTEFEVSEAAEIIFEGKIPEQRPADAHDVIGTYQITSDKNEMSKIPGTFDEFCSIMRSRHALIMQARPDKSPGQFKNHANRAGSTVFVEPDLVIGTLRRGYEIYSAILEPIHRAIFMMFLVAEVHPFTDGNGRIARIMMNAELVAADEQRVIIPTVYRSNYLTALRALSRSQNPTALVRVLNFAQKYTSAINFKTYEAAESDLRSTHAFMDPTEADNQGIRLQLPL